MRAPLQPRGIFYALMLAAAVAGCAGPQPVASAQHLPYGTPIEGGPKPDAFGCQERIRAEIGAAVRIRTELMTPGVGADEGSARAAAADPATDTETLGIPLTAAELRALKHNGLAADNISPIAFRVNVGAPDLFGGLWLRGAVMNVAVVNGEAATLALARCVEPLNVAYVWADVSLAEGSALLDRIGRDRDRWQASGIAINTIDYDETSGVVNVGVSKPTQQALDSLQAAYGSLIRLIKEDAGTPP